MCRESIPTTGSRHFFLADQERGGKYSLERRAEVTSCRGKSLGGEGNAISRIGFRHQGYLECKSVRSQNRIVSERARMEAVSGSSVLERKTSRWLLKGGISSGEGMKEGRGGVGGGGGGGGWVNTEGRKREEA